MENNINSKPKRGSERIVTTPPPDSEFGLNEVQYHSMHSNFIDFTRESQGQIRAMASQPRERFNTIKQRKLQKGNLRYDNRESGQSQTFGESPDRNVRKIQNIQNKKNSKFNSVKMGHTKNQFSCEISNKNANSHYQNDFSNLFKKNPSSKGKSQSPRRKHKQNISQNANFEISPKPKIPDELDESNLINSLELRSPIPDELEESNLVISLENDTPVRFLDSNPLTPSTAKRQGRPALSPFQETPPNTRNPNSHSPHFLPKLKGLNLEAESSAEEFLTSNKYLTHFNGKGFESFQLKSFGRYVLSFDRRFRRLCVFRSPKQGVLEGAGKFFQLNENLGGQSPVVCFDQFIIFYTSQQLIAFDYRWD